MEYGGTGNFIVTWDPVIFSYVKMATYAIKRTYSSIEPAQMVAGYYTPATSPLCWTVQLKPLFREEPRVILQLVNGATSPNIQIWLRQLFCAVTDSMVVPPFSIFW